MRLLFVCTGNICRSPLAERLTSAWAEIALGPAAAGVHIRSAGTDAAVGKPMDKRSAAALVKLGGNPEGFVARAFLPAMADEADLVLTMTRRQRRLVLAAAPRALRRTFTLPEAANLLRAVDMSGLAALPLQQRASDLASRLNERRAYRRAAESDDVFDPIGQSGSVHTQVASRIARKLDPIADVLFAESGATPSLPPLPDLRNRPSLPRLPLPQR
jgi:protein-tyrosine phosphatase